MNRLYETIYKNALLAKSFVILTGNSGTGKTQIAKRIAQFYKCTYQTDKSDLYNFLSNVPKEELEKNEIYLASICATTLEIYDENHHIIALPLGLINEYIELFNEKGITYRKTNDDRNILYEKYDKYAKQEYSFDAQLVKLAKFYCENKNQTNIISNHLLIPVGADWTDNTKILGYYNPLANSGAGEYVKTDVFRFIETAGANPEIPFFLILDEMNLSHVERYFSDFLSKMELLDYTKPDEKVYFDITGYGKLELPKNLFITGTVNIDETTYMFSPKVLDRANVIEFKPEMEDVLDNLLKSSNGDDDKTAESGVAEGFMKLANEVRSGTIPEEVQTVLKEIKPILESFYTELAKCGFEFSYRTVKEIRLYAIAAVKTSEGKMPSATDIADIQILQKILPKIHGNKKQIGTLLEELEKLCEALPNSLAKIRQMKDRLNRFQYASFI